MRALAGMRRSAKEKELNALLSGVNDSCSCFIEVYFVSPSIISLCL
jgi:peptide chain release factor 2